MHDPPKGPRDCPQLPGKGRARGTSRPRLPGCLRPTRRLPGPRRPQEMPGPSQPGGASARSPRWSLRAHGHQVRGRAASRTAAGVGRQPGAPPPPGTPPAPRKRSRTRKRRGQEPTFAPTRRTQHLFRRKWRHQGKRGEVELSEGGVLCVFCPGRPREPMLCFLRGRAGPHCPERGAAGRQTNHPKSRRAEIRPRMEHGVPRQMAARCAGLCTGKHS